MTPERVAANGEGAAAGETSDSEAPPEPVRLDEQLSPVEGGGLPRLRQARPEGERAP